MSEVVVFKEERKAVNRLAALVHFALNAPLIVFDVQKCIVNEAWKAEARLHGFLQVLKGEDAASDFEAMIYLSTASNVAPLSSVGFTLYAYLFSKLYPEKAETIFSSDVFSRDYSMLDSYETMQLVELKRRIYTKQWDFLKRTGGNGG